MTCHDKIRHDCECGHIYYAKPGSRAPYCPRCGSAFSPGCNDTHPGYNPATGQIEPLIDEDNE